MCFNKTVHFLREEIQQALVKTPELWPLLMAIQEEAVPSAPPIEDEVTEESGFEEAEIELSTDEINEWLISNTMIITVQYLKSREMTNKEPQPKVQYPRKVNRFRPPIPKWIKKMFGKSSYKSKSYSVAAYPC